MQKLIKAIPYIFTFALSAIFSFYFYGVYRHFIVYLYKTFQEGRLTITGKNFYLFPPIAFILFLCVFTCATVYLLQKTRIRVLLICIAIVAFFISSVLSSYLCSSAMLIECTACNDNKRTISINHIEYTAHFAAALFFAAIPLAIAYRKSRRRIVDNS